VPSSPAVCFTLPVTNNSASRCSEGVTERKAPSSIRAWPSRLVLAVIVDCKAPVAGSIRGRRFHVPIVPPGRPLFRTFYQGQNLRPASIAPHGRVGRAIISAANRMSTTVLIPVCIGCTENLSHVVGPSLRMLIFKVMSSSSSGEEGLRLSFVLPSN
jgi:hypothetical protein